MTAFARVITIGKNSDMPKILRLPIGVGVDGTTFAHAVRARADEILCPECQGWGEVERSSIDPSVRPWRERCEQCQGDGIVTIEQDASAEWGLPHADAGGSAPAGYAEPPPSSGMTPDACATGGLSLHNVGRGTRSVLRSVPGSSASHRPAADMPPIALQGTWDRVLDGFTVITGLSVFAAVAWFFLVLA